MGVGPSDLVKMIYGTSSRMLWSFSDVLAMQRMYELQRKGFSIRDAVHEAERIIPNYRIPPQVLGSTTFQQFIKNPYLFVFNRYHYGEFKAFANMANDLLGPPAKDAIGRSRRTQAMGKIFVTAVLGSILWPYINRGIQKLTGNKDLELGPKGSLTLPYDAWYALNGDFGRLIESSMTISPVVEGLMQGYNDRDFFNRRIVEPFDWEKKRLGRVGAQIGETAAQDMLAPYSAMSSPFEKGGMAGAAGGMAKQALGLRKTYKGPYHGREGFSGTAAQESNYRRAHPRGPIEELEKKAEQWLKQ
jgi:hypothetical protein